MRAASACPGCGDARSEPFFRKNGFELVECDGCALVRVADPPTSAELDRFYSFAAGYGLEGLPGGSSTEWLKGLAAYHLSLVARASAPGRLLDVGCGAGFFVSEALAAGWTARGIDLNAGVVEQAKAAGLPVERGRMEELEEARGSYDVVTLWDSLEHTGDPRGTLEAVRDALRPGGIAVVSTPNLGGLYPRLSFPIGRLTGYWTHPEPPAHLVQFSTKTLADLFERTGFSVVRVVHDRSPLKYTLVPGGFRQLARRPGRAIYAAAFLPALVLGPYVRAGDSITMIGTRSAA